MSVTAKNFYRRSLPDTCVDFSSVQGKTFFKEALIEGNAEIYFKLASQFKTQDEPAYCGLSTLVMVLNALEVDPERVWKAPWRFYHESMLDCCVPLEKVKISGINLIQFNCLAVCNRLQTFIYHADESEEFLNQLREDLINSVRSDDSVLVAAYDRSVLGQTGSGHFSPLGAYNSVTDSVLIMDVARFKYPPHWVPLRILQKSMCSVDTSTKKTRGYSLLKLQTDSRPLVMFGIKCNLSCNDPEFADSVLSWNAFLLEKTLPKEEEELYFSCRRFAQYFSPHALCWSRKCLEEEEERAKTKKQESETKCCTENFSEACRIVCEEIRNTKISKIFQNGAVAALMIAWPYENGKSERCDRLYSLTQDFISKFSRETKNEIALLNTQLVTMISCNKPPIRIGQPTPKCMKSTDCQCK
ncbi:unnamed protein product [Auanema sp. JU1783]|nr:unnamed protein product [Auanema sp. JU1783]